MEACSHRRAYSALLCGQGFSCWRWWVWLARQDSSSYQTINLWHVMRGKVWQEIQIDPKFLSRNVVHLASCLDPPNSAQKSCSFNAIGSRESKENALGFNAPSFSLDSVFHQLCFCQHRYRHRRRRESASGTNWPYVGNNLFLYLKESIAAFKTF